MRASRAWKWRTTHERASTSLARAGRPVEDTGITARARTFSVDGERDEEGGEEDVGARGRRGKGNRSRWLIDSFD